MDVVYILGSGSEANNEEIRYSIRSLVKNCLDLGKIYIVGENPENLFGLTHIPASDMTDRKWRNAYYKTKTACNIAELSDDFLLMNDDFFMLEPFTIEDFPYYSLKGANGGNCGPLSFQVHCPIRLNKELYKNLPLFGDEKGHLSPRTFYGNFYRCPATPIDDPIIRANKFAPDFDSQIAGLPFFSISDSTMLDPDFVLWLDSLFPERTIYEA